MTECATAPLTSVAAVTKGFDFAYLACLQCGSLFVDPMPSESVLDQMYGPDYRDAHYATELLGGMANREIGREMDDAV